MSVHRSQIRIIADVLSVVRDYDLSNDGIGVSIILRKANVSYSRLTKILSDLVRLGLLEELEQKRGSKYRISKKGEEFLKAYSKFEEFASSYGLRL
ncbi:MAG: DUF4364 family protein [Thaumarchaeota archaeon]|nr:DUF4364 family protein [Nitrososphaerota archaeon]